MTNDQLIQREGNLAYEAALRELHTDLVDLAAERINSVDIRIDEHGLVEMDHYDVGDSLNPGSEEIFRMAMACISDDPTVRDKGRQAALTLVTYIVGRHAQYAASAAEAKLHAEIYGAEPVAFG